MNRTKILVAVTIVVALLAAFRGGEIKVPFIFQLPQQCQTPQVATQVATIVEIPPVRPPVETPSIVSSGGPLMLRVKPAVEALRQGSDGDLYVLVTLEAAKFESKGRLPLNIALALDRSGSMAARNKLDYAKRAAKIVVGQLTESDRIAIVAFDSVSTVLLPSTPVKDPDAINAVIDGLTPGGSTNLSQGMADAKAEVVKYLRKGQINRLLVMTDGLANFGETNPQVLGRFARESGEQGISITTLGLGADYQEDLLLNIAEYSGGRYYFIENPEQMTSIYQAELKGLIRTVARNVRVSLVPAGGAKIEQIFGYRGPTESPPSSCVLGDIFAGQTRKLIVKLKAPTISSGAINPVLTVSLSYEDALRSAPVAVNLGVGTRVTSDEAEVERSVNVDVQARVESVRAASKLEEAMIYLDRGQRAQAQRLLLDQARSSRWANERMYRSPQLSQQALQMEGAARAIDRLPGSSEAYRNYIKSNKFQAYQLTH